MPAWYQRLAWGLVRTAGAPAYLARQGFDVDRSQALPEGPFLLLSNHGNSLDPLALGCLSGAPIRFMANIEGVGALVGAWADLFGAYGRRKGRADLGALRTTCRLAAAGESLGIFPEGDRTWDGATSPRLGGAARLAKRLGLGLVLARQRGNYLARPRWARHGRHGPWTVDQVAYGPDEVAALSEPLLGAIIARALARDDIKDSLAEGRWFEGRGVAEGIERLLWQCPVCGKDDDGEGRGSPLRGQGEEIHCRRCGSRWALDANLRLRPLNLPEGLMARPLADLKDWSDWQRSRLPELLDPPGGGGILARQVRLSRAVGTGREALGQGTLSLREGVVGFEVGKDHLSFPAPEIRGFVDNFNAYSEFSFRGTRWRVDFQGGNAAKWCHALGGAA